MLRRALTCRCPCCGEGALFQGFLAFRPNCAHCGLDLARADSGDGPAVFLIFVLGFLAIPPILIFAMHSDWPLWLHGIIWSLTILGLTLGLLRPAKALTAGLQYRYRSGVFNKES